MFEVLDEVLSAQDLKLSLPELLRNLSRFPNVVNRLPSAKKLQVVLAAQASSPMELSGPAQAQVVFWINGREVARGTVERTIPASFTASETFDVGLDTNSPVADDYFDRAPFAFNGALRRLHFVYR